MPNCILIGSGPGIGSAVARRFGGGGYRVGLIARSPENLADQTEHLQRLGISADWAVAYAGDGAALEQAMAELIGRMGRCDVLIYNAAVMRPESPLALSGERLMREFSVNVLGAHLAARMVAPGMVERGAGTILFTGGGLALEPFAQWTSLALGKAALRSLGFSLFKELAPKGVRVCVITICGIVKRGGPFDADLIARQYWHVATGPRGEVKREVVFQPDGADLSYNAPN
jgi:NAD(P)-dependent dehydrogenase (short-subunit alcohol dehydrogenase family)